MGRGSEIFALDFLMCCGLIVLVCVLANLIRLHVA